MPGFGDLAAPPPSGASPSSSSTYPATATVLATATMAATSGTLTRARRSTRVVGVRVRGPLSATRVGTAVDPRVTVASRRQYGPRSFTAISSSACHATPADAGRADGALARSHWTHSQTGPGTSGAKSASGGGGLWTWQYRTASGARSGSNGGRPARSSYAMTPTA